MTHGIDYSEGFPKGDKIVKLSFFSSHLNQQYPESTTHLHQGTPSNHPRGNEPGVQAREREELGVAVAVAAVEVEHHLLAPRGPLRDDPGRCGGGRRLAAAGVRHALGVMVLHGDRARCNARQRSPS